MSIDPLDLYTRLTKGERMSETDFDRLLITKTKDIVSRYGIEYDPGEVIPTDEALLDTVWKAGYELALEAGLYCKDTRRRVQLSKEEIETAIQEMQVHRSRRQTPVRQLDDKRPLQMIAGPFGAPASEKTYLPLCISYVQEPGMIGFATPSLTSFHGFLGKAGTPAEIMTIRQEVLWAREALARVNKKDLFIVPAPQRSLSMASILGIEGSEPICTLFMPHLKVAMDNVLFYTLLHENDMLHVGTSQFDWVGVHGGPEATLLITLAQLLLALGIFGASEGSSYGAAPLTRGRDGRVSTWIHTLISQNSARHGLRFYSGAGVSRTGTGRTLVDVVIGIIMALACGDSCSHVGVCGVESCSGLDYRIGFEANMGMAGVTRKEANELITSLLAYRRRQEVPAENPKFEDCYDLRTVQPTKEWAELYDSTKKDMQALGVKFVDARDFS